MNRINGILSKWDKIRETEKAQKNAETVARIANPNHIFRESYRPATSRSCSLGSYQAPAAVPAAAVPAAAVAAAATPAAFTIGRGGSSHVRFMQDQ